MLETERLVVRPFQESDYADFYEYMSRPEIYRFERGRPVSLAEAQKMCAEYAQDGAYLAATLKDGGKMVGHVCLNRIRPESFRTYNLAYIFSPDYQRRGYASEAARAVVDYGFRILGAHRIVGHCSPDNTASRKVLENCGLTREGMSRRDFLWRTDDDGRPIWLDSLEYAILETDDAAL